MNKKLTIMALVVCAGIMVSYGHHHHSAFWGGFAGGLVGGLVRPAPVVVATPTVVTTPTVVATPAPIVSDVGGVVTTTTTTSHHNLMFINHKQHHITSYQISTIHHASL